MSNGSTTVYAVPFLFVDRSDIQVFVNGAPTTAFTWTSQGLIQLGAAPAAGLYVTIERRTVADTSAISFNGIPRPTDLTTAFRKVLYIAQEALENAAGALHTTLPGLWDALGRRIANVADPVDPQDAATKAWVQARTMAIDPVQNAWDGENLRVERVANPTQPQDAATKAWVQNYVVGGTTDPGTVSVLPPGWTTSTSLSNYMLRRGPTPYDFGAVGDGVTDDTAAFNAALDWLGNNGGGTLWVPNLATGWICNGTILMLRNYVSMKGLANRTMIKCNGTTNNNIHIGDETHIVYNCHVENIYIYNTSPVRTNGTAFRCRNANISNIHECIVDGAWNGVSSNGVNTLHVTNTQIITGNGFTGTGFYAYSDPNGGQRTDIIYCENFVVQAHNSGAAGIVVDGAVNSCQWKHIYMLGVRRGMEFSNTPGVVGEGPQFHFIYDLEVDRATDAAVVIDQGWRLEFTACEIGNTSEAADVPYPQGGHDGSTIQINPGMPTDLTRDIKFNGGRVGNTQQCAFAISAQDVYIRGVTCNDSSKFNKTGNAANGLPVIYLAPGANNFIISDCLIDGTGRSSYGVSIGNGCSRGMITGNIIRSVNANFFRGTGTDSVLTPTGMNLLV